MITQSEYEGFRDNINALIQEYREKFSAPVITDSGKYEETYRKRLLGMSMELRSMIDHASSIVLNLSFARIAEKYVILIRTIP